MRDEDKREWDEQHERMVSSLLRDFKCLEYGEYLMDEFRLILRKLERDMKQVFHEAKFAMEAVMKLMPDASFSQSVSIFFVVLSLLWRVDVFNINRDKNIMWI